jgi:hypothetical protein
MSAVDLDTGAIVGVTVQDADEGLRLLRLRGERLKRPFAACERMVFTTGCQGEPRDRAVFEAMSAEFGKPDTVFAMKLFPTWKTELSCSTSARSSIDIRTDRPR